ncbi:unnamed protein product, partial [Symbiodinium microadriaticum]
EHEVSAATASHYFRQHGTPRKTANTLPDHAGFRRRVPSPTFPASRPLPNSRRRVQGSPAKPTRLSKG